MNMDTIIQHARELYVQAWSIWASGGWAMVAIAATGFVMFSLGVHVFFSLRRKGFESLSSRTWRRWIDDPDRRRGPVGDLLNFVMGEKSLKDTEACFRELQATEIAPFRRDLKVMKICVGVAPLLGLLGTVVGMLATFSALSTGRGGDKTMGMIAEGISTALVTTETGLVVALAGLFMQHQLARRHERYEAFLADLETTCTQAVYKRLHSRRVAQTPDAQQHTPRQRGE